MPRFKFITCGRNAQQWLKSCLDSLLNQDWDDFEVLYLDDASDHFDPSEYENHPKLKIYRNKTRQGMTVNFRKLIHQCDDDDYVVRVDADDWLLNNHQLKDIAKVHQDGFEMTYGGLVTTIRGIAEQIAPIDIVRSGDIRALRFGFHFQGIRSTRAKYIKAINDNDLKYNDNWIPVLNDGIIYACVSEMLREKVYLLDGERYYWNTSESVNNNFKTDNRLLYQEIWDDFSRKNPYAKI